MQGKLIALKEEVLRVMARGHVKEDLYDAVSRAFDRHEAEQGEGLRRFEKWFALFVARLYDNGHIKKDDPMFEAYIKFRIMIEESPTSDKAVEPLAVFADQYGWFLKDVMYFRAALTWSICLCRKQSSVNYESFKQIEARTYALAEAKARAYLEGLADKEGV